MVFNKYIALQSKLFVLMEGLYNGGILYNWHIRGLSLKQANLLIHAVMNLCFCSVVCTHWFSLKYVLARETWY